MNDGTVAAHMHPVFHLRDPNILKYLSDAPNKGSSKVYLIKKVI